MPIQAILFLAFAIALIVTWKRMRESTISRREAFGWSLLWIAGVVVIMLPQTTTAVANVVGIGRGVDLVLYASVVLLFTLVFRLFIALDRTERRLTDIVRDEALKDIPPQS